MQAVTQAFKDAIYASTRQCTATVTFSLIDVTAGIDAAISSASAYVDYSTPDTMLDQDNETNKNFATLEANYTLLDGSFEVAPDGAAGPTDKTGLIIDVLSNSAGYFEFVQPVITIDFDSPHTLLGLTFDFDTQNGEGLKEFRVDYYDNADLLIASETVVDNYTEHTVVELGAVAIYRIVITCIRTQKPYRRVRIEQLVFGVILDYFNKDITKFTLLKEVDLLSKEIASDELVVSFSNLDKRFNILNPTGITTYLQQKQKFIVRLGVMKADGKSEQVITGNYFITEWNSPSNSLVATITAREIFDAMLGTTYRKGVFSATNTMLDVLTDVLIDSKVADLDVSWVLDPVLDTIPCKLPIPVVSHKEAIRMIAEASRCVCFTDNEGKIHVERFVATDAVDVLSYDKVFKPPIIDLQSFVTKATCKINTWAEAADTIELYNGVVSNEGAIEYWFEYSSIASSNISTYISGGTVIDATYYANAARIVILGSGLPITVIISGKSGTMSFSEVSVTNQANQTGSTVNVENKLITELFDATALAQHVFDYYQRRYKYKTTWRQNPALDVLDIVTVQDDYAQNKDVTLTKHTYTYNGALKGTSEGIVM